MTAVASRYGATRCELRKGAYLRLTEGFIASRCDKGVTRAMRRCCESRFELQLFYIWTTQPLHSIIEPTKLRHRLSRCVGVRQYLLLLKLPPFANVLAILFTKSAVSGRQAAGLRQKKKQF